MSRLRDRLTANIGFLFAELPFLDRIDAASMAGFDKVECHFPYDIAVDVLKRRLDRAGVLMTGLNTAPGDVAAGEWGLCGVPGKQMEFERHIDQALHYARALSAKMIHVMAGVVEPAQSALAREIYVDNLRQTASKASDDGITLLLEPLNSRDKQGYLVSTTDEIAAIIEEVAAPNVKLLFDAYHVQIMEGDLTTRLNRYADVIGHVQIAAVPDRGEPDRGEINLHHIFETLDSIGYAGLIGLEYRPRGSTLGGLKWMEEFILLRDRPGLAFHDH